MSDIGQNLSNFASRLEAIAEKQRDVYDKGYSDAIGIGPPSGEIELPENGTFDVAAYATAKVNVAASCDCDAKLPSVIDGTVAELTAEDLAGATSVRAYAFFKCQNLTKISLTDRLATIGAYAFSESGVTDIQIPNSIISFGDYAFANCSNLVNATLSDGIIHIQSYIFYKCANLANVSIPNSVRTIGNYSFSYCPKLTDIVLPEGLTYIGMSAFYNSGLKTIDIPESVTTVDANAFNICQSLESIRLPNNIESIGSSICRQCINLESADLGNSLKRIESQTFYRCEKLHNIVVPSSVTFIGDQAFYQCYLLEYVDLTAFVEGISFPTLQYTNVFQYAGRDTAKGTFEIRVPVGRKAELAAMANWSTYANNIVEYEPPEIIDFYIDGALYSAEEGMTWQRWVNSEYSSESFTITDNFVRPVSDPHWNVVDSINENPVLSTDVILWGAEYKTMSYD